MLSSYFGGVAVFLIFAGFVSLIAPQKKYKEYIDLIMAFGLVLILLNPIGSAMRFLSGANGIPSLTMEMAGIVAPDVAHIEQTQRELVLAAFREELAFHLERIVDIDGDFTLTHSEIKLDAAPENFAAITGITVWVSEGQAEAPENQRQPFIRVERVEITPFTQRPPVNEPDREDVRITRLKNAISSFYQIGNEHINIFVVS